MKRRIVEINKEKCNGCGICVNACHEGAIVIVDGKAELLSDEYCDGLGDCLHCPEGAITIVEREAAAYDEEKVQQRMKELKKEKSPQPNLPCGCPGSAAKAIQREAAVPKPTHQASLTSTSSEAMLQNWPVQLELVPVKAGYFNGANLLIAADCSAYAYANFHQDFIAGRITLIGCPKLDDNGYYTDKLTEILKENNIKSITVVRMEVPCCGGIVQAVKRAMLASEVIVPYEEVIISTDGQRK